MQTGKEYTSAQTGVFTCAYVRHELWDLLDSVTFYGRESCGGPPDPHITYRCLLALVEVAYALYQVSR